jgi:hypothetical protein
MEPYPFHYSCRSRSDEPDKPTVRMMSEEMQRMGAQLGEKIEGHCTSLEQQVSEVEQRLEERLTSLEMARSKSEQGHVALEKQFDGLRLEVGRMIHLLEHENLIHSQSKPRIFSAGELPTLPGSMGATVDRSKRSREEVSPNGMSHHPLPQSRGLEQLSESHHARGVDSYGDVVRASHAQLPKLNFPLFSGVETQLWKSRCENYFEMYGLEPSLWIKVASMHLEGAARRWFQSMERQVRDV